MARFEKDFLLGTATAAHQVEGNNIHSDAWAQEHMTYTSYAEPSGDAVDHYHRYEEDILLLKNAGLNAYRFSIEWARIEPEEGCFDAAEIDHYRHVIRFCRQNEIEPILTLHHFTSPVWLIRKGGWEFETVPQDFARYARYVMEQLGNELTYVCTINEANMGIQIASVARAVMQRMMAAMQKESDVQVGVNLEQMLKGSHEAAEETLRVFGVPKAECFISPRTAHGDELIMQAHIAAREAIRKSAPHVKVGLTLSLHDIQPVLGGEERAQLEWDAEFMHYLPTIRDDDFLGVQNYTRTLMGAEGSLPCPDDAELTQMDYEYYPAALGNVLRRVAQDFDGELLVTENGIATADDARRQAFIEAATADVASCIADGLPVKGYLYWSLLDNFEWQKGYGMTFGLIAVDRASQKRFPKDSLYALGKMR